MRGPDMSYTEFLALAEEKVEENFPQWYVPGVKRDLKFDEMAMKYASVSKKMDGTFVMTIFEPAWDLCAVEDLTLVLLHEYVHIKIWDKLNATVYDPFCRSAMHELYAYRVELSQDKIKSTLAMRQSSKAGYANNYRKAKSSCPERLLKDFPEPEGVW